MASKIVSRVAKVGAIAAMTVGLGVAGQVASAEVAPQPATISASPSTGLADGQTVTVKGTGLDAGMLYTVGQCGPVSATETACNTATWKDVTAGADGTLSTPLVVRSKFVGTSANGATYTIDCKAVSCVAAVFDASFNGGTAALSFR